GTPAGFGPDRQTLGQDVVAQGVVGILVAVDHVRQGQEDVVGGGRGDPRLVVGVLADPDPFEMGRMGEAVVVGDRADEEGAEAELVARARPDALPNYAVRAKPFVGGYGNLRPSPLH